ncbi:MAG: OmpA family protein [Xanthomonadales bacterium]|nr:OmpA family protein [Xanthomonadales bacterium]
MRNTRTLTISALAAAVLMASGCSNYVKREDYDAVVSELRSRDSSLQSQIDANKSAIEQLRSSLEARLSAHEAQIQQLAGRLHVDMNVHFAYDSADLREQDRGTLDAFSQVINGHHPNAHITVEGFTDAAGNAAYNQRLGQRRADAVRDYLVSSGLGADRVTAVSYGEERKRQLSPGAWGDNGLANRRVTLVVDLPPVS